MRDDIFVSPADLPIVNGAVYHLALRPGELAKDILIMGDPGRVSSIAEEFLETIEVDRFHRGLRSITGRVRETGQRVSLITSGMGAPSAEIVLNEVIALNEIDFRTRTRKTSYEKITMVRVGTSGGVKVLRWERSSSPLLQQVSIMPGCFTTSLLPMSAGFWRAASGMPLMM